jgi:rhodanese-related sulfurtransferase
MKTIEAKQLKETLDANTGTTVINTLSKDAFDAKHIPKSVNVPQDEPEFVDRVEKMTSGKADPVVVYCASASCDSSTKAGKKLEEAGFTNVYEFEGGVDEWEKSQLPLVSSA